jgi:hypothetical protein
MIRQDTRKVEFGDFQTPDELASQAARLLATQEIAPATIVEPTCGRGSFLVAALKQFPHSRAAVGLEIHPDYFKVAHQRVMSLHCRQRVDMRQADFFRFDWSKVFAEAAEPILVIGNPPWVTASLLGALESENLPRKSNFQNHRGLDAVTGKSNFDIAEWMLIHLLEWLKGKEAVLAMLVKTSVARKVLCHAWKQDWPLVDAAIYEIDAGKFFGVSADAGLLVCRVGKGKGVTRCGIYDLASPGKLRQSLAFHNGWLLSDWDAFRRHQVLLRDPHRASLYRWRSGVKHDCSKVMELTRNPGGLMNGHGEIVAVEPYYLYPMLKGSSVANGHKKRASKYMLVTQTQTAESTHLIRTAAPKTWTYLTTHADELDGRGSSIYRKRPRFCVFGIGEYTFSPWKVAICGLYKRLEFSVIGPRDGKPVVVDDTVYFLSCQSREEADLLAGLLDTPEAGEFLGSFIFWDAKRPITAEILGRLDLEALARMHGKLDRLMILGKRTAAPRVQQRLL